ncbi:endoplasmic reticulum resident protein 29 [Aricia agestis]|uniref:endoplasmic reticulum resident protein 29 n=1 Tax=Aricia agestis TaxID=91739 RepID=UPI001C20325A|nr:endoplasmic reticulum resident protein 29 [Aricia agestis]
MDDNNLHMKMQTIILVNLITFTTLAHKVYAAGGSVELYEYSFDKVIGKFEASLVKFDVAFPYGDKHDAFVALAKESRDVGDLLFAEVGVKDYGEKDNEALAKKYGATKDNFPVVKLFLKDQTKPIAFDETKGFTSDELRRFVREKSGIFLSLPGCVKELDLQAIKFIKSNSEDRKLVLKETEDIVKKLNNKEATSGKIYKMIMEKIIEKGNDFIKTENERVQKLLNTKISDAKKKELENRINILQSFQFSDKRKGKEEL